MKINYSVEDGWEVFTIRWDYECILYVTKLFKRFHRGRHSSEPIPFLKCCQEEVCANVQAHQRSHSYNRTVAESKQLWLHQLSVILYRRRRRMTKLHKASFTTICKTRLNTTNCVRHGSTWRKLCRVGMNAAVNVPKVENAKNLGQLCWTELHVMWTLL